MLDTDKAEQMIDYVGENAKVEALNRKIWETSHCSEGRRWIRNIDEILEEWREIKNYAAEKLDLSNCDIDCDQKEISGEIMNVDFHGSDFRGKTVIKGANLTSCDFSQTNMMDIHGGEIIETNMNACSFQEANIEKVKMEHVSLHWVDFSKARLADTELTEVLFNDCYFKDTKMENTRMQGCIGKGQQSFVDTIQISWEKESGRHIDQEYVEKNKREIYRVLTSKKEMSLNLDAIQKIKNVPYDTLVQESLEAKSSYERQTRHEISDNIRKSGFAPTDHMIKNIQKLDHLTGQKNTLKDIMNLHKKSGADIQPDVKKIVESVADECRGQEQAINMYRQRMVQMNTVQAPAL